MKFIDQSLFDELLEDAAKSTRKRSHYKLHQSEQEPVQRLCIGLHKGTYIRPHRHIKSNKWELLMVLQGTIGLITFNDYGKVIDKYELRPENSTMGIEIEPEVWHSIYPISNEAIIFEVKEGPYIPNKPEEFAAWSPAEGAEHIDDFIQKMETCQIGSHIQK